MVHTFTLSPALSHTPFAPRRRPETGASVRTLCGETGSERRSRFPSEGGVAGVGEGGFGSVPALGSSAARSCEKSSERLVNTFSAKRVTPFLRQ